MWKVLGNNSSTPNVNLLTCRLERVVATTEVVTRQLCGGCSFHSFCPTFKARFVTDEKWGDINPHYNNPCISGPDVYHQLYEYLWEKQCPTLKHMIVCDFPVVLELGWLICRRFKLEMFILVYCTLVTVLM